MFLIVDIFLNIKVSLTCKLPAQVASSPVLSLMLFHHLNILIFNEEPPPTLIFCTGPHKMYIWCLNPPLGNFVLSFSHAFFLPAYVDYDTGSYYQLNSHLPALPDGCNYACPDFFPPVNASLTCCRCWVFMAYNWYCLEHWAVTKMETTNLLSQGDDCTILVPECHVILFGIRLK